MGTPDLTAAAWTVEGVIWCPDCQLYHDFSGTPKDLETFISAHRCAKEADSR